jgi:ATP-dependent exoDNAse (exonuclease V) alpha subunit
MMLQWNLLYTAVTRGKRLVVLVGAKKALGIAVRRQDTSRRYTALGKRLEESLMFSWLPHCRSFAIVVNLCCRGC